MMESQLGRVTLRYFSEKVRGSKGAKVEIVDSKVGAGELLYNVEKGDFGWWRR